METVFRRITSLGMGIVFGTFLNTQEIRLLGWMILLFYLRWSFEESIRLLGDKDGTK